MDAPLVDLLSRQGHRRVAMCGSDKPLKASKREARSKINIPHRAFWKTTRSIGGRCTRGNTLSRAVLIRPPASLIWLARPAGSPQARLPPLSYHYAKGQLRQGFGEVESRQRNEPDIDILIFLPFLSRRVMRRGPTRSHPEHGRDTRQRRWYCPPGGSVGPRLLFFLSQPLSPCDRGFFLTLIP